MKGSLDDPQADLSQAPPEAGEFAAHHDGNWLHSPGARWLVIGLGFVVLLAVVSWPLVHQQSKQAVASYWLERAQADYEAGNLSGALEKIDHAFPWLPDNLALYLARAEWRREAGRLSQSLEDYAHVIRLNPTYAAAYTGRSRVYQQLGRHAEALADLNTALRESPQSDPEPWNTRAYGRALAGVDLAEALDDVERAIKLSTKEQGAFLDTRGYLLHLLGDQESALQDMDRALELNAADRKRITEAAHEAKLSPSAIELVVHEYDHAEAVMVHHRGLVHEKLGHDKQAQDDFQRAKKLGYDPAAGVY